MGRQRSRTTTPLTTGHSVAMPKNKGKGGKNRRRGKNENDNEKRELTFKEEGQEYAQVVKMLGNGRLEAVCFDGSKRLAHIRGKLRKKVWINQGDIILLSLREYQDEKGDVILKYSADEARSLKAYGDLPETAKINETDTYGGEEEGGIGFDFGEDDSDSDGEIDVDDIEWTFCLSLGCCSALGAGCMRNEYLTADQVRSGRKRRRTKFDAPPSHRHCRL